MSIEWALNDTSVAVDEYGECAEYHHNVLVKLDRSATIEK